MNEWLNLSDGGWWHVAGWTMLHFLWLGTLVGLAAGICRLVLRRASANVRYVAALTGFVALTVLPIGIGAWLATQRPSLLVDDNERLFAAVPQSIPEAPAAPGSAGGDSGILSAERTAPTTPTIAGEFAIETHSGTNPRQSRGLPEVFASLAKYLPWAWLTGTPLTFLLLTTGVIGAERLRRSSRILSDGPISDACAELARSLRIGRAVTVAVCERIATPVLVGVVRPMILLPPAALTGWSPDEIEMVLLHELAHVRRWDNLVNLLQRFVEAALFFHPAVWLVSRWVRAEREACCDAVVVGRTNRPHAYAEMLVALAAQLPRSVLFHPAATSAMAAGPLRSRIHRILALDSDPMLVSGKSLGVVMSGLLLAATLVVLNLPTNSQAEDKHIARSISVNDPTLVDVQFEVGTSKFENGDTIKITEVRGTAGSFQPGNEYWIRGTYTLGSRDRATLGGNVTSQTRSSAVTPNVQEQSTEIKRGHGEFQLKLPMRGDGWPHVSFYPADGGESFGGVYFGTGASVLKEWWTNNKADDSQNSRDDVHLTADAEEQTKLNLKKLLGALFHYQESKGTLPAYATFDANGKPLLSWRVHLLPFLGEEKLYQEFRTDEAWDSPHNRRLLKFMPEVYRDPRLRRDSLTNYLAVLGPDCCFSESGEERTTEMFANNLLKTIALVEVNPDHAVEWTKPQDWKFDRSNPTAGLGLNWPKHWFGVQIGGDIEEVDVDAPVDKVAQMLGPARTEVEKLLLNRATNKPNASPPEAKKFPTLEEQRQADLAWKRLGVEFAPLLERLKKNQSKKLIDYVREHGYEGGVMVMAKGNPRTEQEDLQTFDILVGLHVWPVTSMKDLAEILARVDLAQMNPMKFYALRVTKISEDSELEFVPITGRIHLNLDDQRRLATLPSADRFSVERPEALTPQDMAAMATSRPTQPLPAIGSQPESRFIDPLPANVAKIFREHGPVVVDVFYQDNSQPCRSMLESLQAFQRANLDLPVEINHKNTEVERASLIKYKITATPTLVVSKNGEVLFKFVGITSAAGISEFLAGVADKLAESADDQPTLRYNGKTFEEWRTAWQTELSLEKRLEVVKALAAFGASGRGQEAAEAILDVANQLDWSFIDNESAAGRLKQACIDAFVSGRSTEGYRIPTEAWWPLVAPLYENAGDKWTIATYLSYQLPAGEKELIPKLLELSNKSEATRNLALSGLKAIDPQREDDRVVARLRELLNDSNKQPAELRGAINSLLYSRSSGGGGYGPPVQLRWVPELQPLLFHPDPEVRQTARFAIAKAEPRDATPLVEYLVNILDTQGNGKDRRGAIRALAALDTRATPAEERLKAIARDPKDINRLPAAAALLALWPDVASWDINSKMNKLFGENMIADADEDDVSRKLKAEQDLIFGGDRQTYGGGGVF